MLSAFFQGYLRQSSGSVPDFGKRSHLRSRHVCLLHQL